MKLRTKVLLCSGLPLLLLIALVTWLLLQELYATRLQLGKQSLVDQATRVANRISGQNDDATRIARFAFDYARQHGRRRVTAIHKANIMKQGDGLFLSCTRAVARQYPDIVFDERIVDAACMHLVMTPEKFDVLVMPNLYGDIVSDLCAGLVGGLGVVGAANLGAEAAVFEAGHGSEIGRATRLNSSHRT